jgi:hypothetical protein
MANLRNTAVSRLRLAGYTYIAKAAERAECTLLPRGTRLRLGADG